MSARAPRSVLLAGFEPEGPDMYPHTQAVLNALRTRVDVTYVVLPERGDFTGKLAAGGWSLRSMRGALGPLARAVAAAAAAARAGTPDVVVAVDEVPFVLMDAAFPGTPVVLWSHDFRGADEAQQAHPSRRVLNAALASALRRHRRVVVQDAGRLSGLLAPLGVPPGDVDWCALPVGVEDVPPPHVASWTGGPPTLLQLGGLRADRFTDALVLHHAQHADSYQLMLHGFMDGPTKERVASQSVRPQVSTRRVPPGQLHQVVRKAHVGFVGYRASNENHRHLAMASGQLVEFLRLGIPVLSMGPNDLGSFLESSGAGQGVPDMDALGGALRHILSDHAQYAQRARRAFQAHFEVGPLVSRLVDWLPR